MDEVRKFLYEVCKEYVDKINIYNDDGNVSVDKWDLKMYVLDMIHEMEEQIRI